MIKRRYSNKRKELVNRFDWGSESKAAFGNAFKTENLAGSLGSIGGGVTSIIQAGMDNAKLEDTTDIENQIESAEDFEARASSNDSLLNLWQNRSFIDNVDATDLRKSTGEMISNTLGSTISGASSGATIGGPIGAIAGGAMGLLSGVFGGISAVSNSKKLANNLNSKIDNANNLINQAYVNEANRIEDLNDINAMTNLLAEGGGIHISPSKRGTFTAAAKRHGKSVQAFASQVLANKDNYSSAMVKKANFARNASKGKHADGGPRNPYSTGALVDAIYSFSNGDKFLGKPSHNYDFTISEEEANKLGYYPDERGHRDDRVKKPAHPTHTSRGKWNSFEEFRLTDKGMENPNYTLFGLVDGGQDPQAVMTYKGGVVLPEITVTPKESYIMNPYDNIKIFDKGGSLTNKKSSSRRLNNNYKEGEIYDVTEEEVKLLKELGYEFEYV